MPEVVRAQLDRRRPPRVAAAVALLVAGTLVSTLPAVAIDSAAATDTEAAALSPWRGSVDLYRAGGYSMQHTWWWCVPANVQMMRNIAERRSNHGRAQQQRYFSYMRKHDRYRIPVRHGVDPAGWKAGLRRFVDRRYDLVRRDSFKKTLRSAVRNLRLTNLPVSIAVARGNHAWVLTGFSATADPATSKRFKVTSVRVSGPLWGRQNSGFGYDMRPNTRLSRTQLKGFVKPWHYGPVRMAWEGEYVSLQPVHRGLRPVIQAQAGLLAQAEDGIVPRWSDRD